MNEEIIQPCSALYITYICRGMLYAKSIAVGHGQGKNHDVNSFVGLSILY